MTEAAIDPFCLCTHKASSHNAGTLEHGACRQCSCDGFEYGFQPRAMTDHPKPSAEALAQADVICQQHGMLRRGYMATTLAVALDAFAAQAVLAERARLADEGDASRRVATMLGQPITMSDLKRISEDGP